MNDQILGVNGLDQINAMESSIKYRPYKFKAHSNISWNLHLSQDWNLPCMFSVFFPGVLHLMNFLTRKNEDFIASWLTKLNPLFQM